jgi:hypothetical protein
VRPDWAGGLRQNGIPGESSARARLNAFLETGVAGYSIQRDRPDRDGTSGLSPHLRFGELGPRQVWHAARFAAAARPALAGDIDKFLSELGWREFCRHLLFDVSDLAERNLQPAFDAFPWRRDDRALKAWQRGQTGYPIVDAGMRQLWHTGTMHNRVRMVVASFLVKHLLIDWREGEKCFWDTLVDADPAATPPTGNGSPARAPMPHPISACSTRSCRARSSIPTARMSDAGCPNWRDCRPAPSTSRGAQRRLSSPVPASNSARHIRTQSWITDGVASAH